MHSFADISHFVRQLDDLAAGCDPDFDNAHEELERDFAERRLHFTNAK